MLEFVDVCKTFRLGGEKSAARQLKRRVVLDNVNITVPDGQFVCLLGPSGNEALALKDSEKVLPDLTEADLSSALDGLIKSKHWSLTEKVTQQKWDFTMNTLLVGQGLLTTAPSYSDAVVSESGS